VADLISKAHGAQLAARIDPAARITDVTPGPIPKADTIYLTVVDRDRRAVSLINSVYYSFGSGIVTEKTGIALQNRGACFSLEEGHANEMAGGKRPMHTIIPAFMLKNGKPVMPFGVMGGAYQACGHAHVVSNMVDFGMDPQAAIDAPRAFFTEDWTGVELERGMPTATREAIARLGHQVETPKEAIGGGQAILIDHERGVLIAGSEPRKDGHAAGY
jgi:gamma-glutamyltranspeptidase/glutathione hydrolase